MTWKHEPLHRGLHTSMDPAMAPEGSLQLARNARYRPNDPAIWQSEGRKEVADGLHGTSQPVQAVAGIQWDPGSIKETGKDELEQIIYTPTGGTTLLSVPALPDPDDPGMNGFNGENLTQYTMPSGINPDLTSGVLTTVQYNNEHFILTGGDNLRFYRDDSGQALSAHGYPTITSPVDNLSFVTDVAQQAYNFDFTDSAITGDYYLWWTWYDSTTDTEGTAEVDASIYDTISTADGYAYLGFYFIEATFDAARAAAGNPDSIRIYISPANDTGIGTEAGRQNGWPFGYRIATVAYADFVTRTGFHLFDIVKAAGAPSSRYNIIITQAQLENIPFHFPLFDFRTIVSAGVGVNMGANGGPPKATTGDIFEESLVLNDVNDKRKVRFSLPGTPTSFPALYYINFETSARDEVVAIRSIGNKLGVFLQNSIWRVNWLPSTSDLDFGRGRVMDEVSNNRGSYKHNTVTKFTMRGQPLLAYLSRTGVYATDLYTEIELTENLDWDKATDGKAISDGILLNDPDNDRLILMLGNEMYFLHYDHGHLDEKNHPAITGPIQRPGRISCANLIQVQGGDRVIITGAMTSTGLYYEGFVYQDEADTALTLEWGVKTRDVYPFGAGNDGQMGSFMGHFKPSSIGTGTWQTRVNGWLSGTQGPTIKIAPEINASIRQLKVSTGRALFEFYNVELVGSSTQASMACNFVGVDVDPLGRADAR